METTDLIEMLRGFAVGSREIGNRTVADMVTMAADRLEAMNKSLKVARTERDQARQMQERAERLLSERPSGDLISREALLEEFRWLKSVVNPGSVPEVEEYIARIEKAPAVCEDVHPDWYQRLSDLDYVYNPEPNGEPWYQAKDVWACIEEEPKDV